jgi:hypothetical protein
MPPRNNKQKAATDNLKKGKNGGGDSGKKTVSRAAAAAAVAAAIQNDDLVCYHGNSTVEKKNDPNFHKVHGAYFALKREYTQYLQSSPDGKILSTIYGFASIMHLIKSMEKS